MSVSATQPQLRRPTAIEHAAISALCAEYFDRADRGGPSPAELFAADGTLTLGAMHAAGRGEICAFFERRSADNAAADRQVRHLFTPPHIVMRDTDCAIARSCIAVFAGNGTPPLPSSVPATLFDFEDVIVREGGEWRFHNRTARILFAGDNAAKFTRAPEFTRTPAETGQS